MSAGGEEDGAFSWQREDEPVAEDILTAWVALAEAAALDDGMTTTMELEDGQPTQQG